MAHLASIIEERGGCINTSAAPAAAAAAGRHSRKRQADNAIHHRTTQRTRHPPLNYATDIFIYIDILKKSICILYTNFSQYINT